MWRPFFSSWKCDNQSTPPYRLAGLHGLQSYLQKAQGLCMQRGDDWKCLGRRFVENLWKVCKLEKAEPTSSVDSILTHSNWPAVYILYL